MPYYLLFFTLKMLEWYGEDFSFVSGNGNAQKHKMLFC